MMRWCLLLFISSSIALAACGSTARRPEFSGGHPVHDCPEHLEGQVRLHAEARPIEMRAGALRESSIATAGSVGRRLLISVNPAGLQPEDRIVWSELTVTTYGGTFLGWDERPDAATVTLAPGQLKLARVARGRADLAGMYSIDTLLMPGGVVVDDTVVRIPKLWHENGKPLSPDAVTPELVPIRHPPGLDIVEASLRLDFVVRLGASGDEWVCSAETRATLVDQDALRQPFWDLGLAWSNAVRREWLALFDPALGGIRLMFDSPARAHALADWIRATRSSRLGSYEVGVFQPSTRLARRPFAAVNEDSRQTLRPLADQDIDAIVVGPVAEP
jgi:hypothetical protein